MSGNGHTTRYGNYYTQEEWDAMTANFDREDRAAEDYVEQEAAIISQAAKLLEPVAGEKAYSVAHHIFNNGIDGIEFGGKSSRELAETVSEWMDQEARKL